MLFCEDLKKNMLVSKNSRHKILKTHQADEGLKENAAQHDDLPKKKK